MSESGVARLWEVARCGVLLPRNLIITRKCVCFRPRVNAALQLVLCGNGKGKIRKRCVYC